ncbi:MAG: beta-ketoacyl-ACP synthase II [Gammaproteobacteria bacterium]|nr:beta-ketoacyl-ACP synthase II [Gammaproteobacteria bacterium]
MPKKVVITGIGCLSPIGNSVNEVWQSLIEGVSGISSVEDDVLKTLRSTIYGGVKNLSNFKEDKTLKRMDPFIKYAVWAAEQCLENANLKDGWCDPYRVGTLIATGIGGLNNIEINAKKAFVDPSRVSPFFIPATIPNMASGLVSMKYGFKGPSFTISSACSSGTHAIANGAMMIQSGLVDAMVVGASEKASDLLGMSGFNSMRALSNRNDDPISASRPWDKDRNGFVLADGAGILLLESEENAKKRGAKVHAELAGYGFSSDAYHMTQPDETGAAAIHAMDQAISTAGIEKEELGYINAHATSTIIGDVIEASAIEKCFASSNPNLLVSSTKSLHGHLLGAAGALESIITILSLKHSKAPFTINLDNLDFDTSLNFVCDQMISYDSKYALTNSFGFGGTNGSLLFKKV